MVEEIINFERFLQEDGMKNQEIKEEGIYVWVKYVELGKFEIKIGQYQKKSELNQFIQDSEHFEKCFERLPYVEGFAAANERFDAPVKLNKSSSPYCAIIDASRYKARIEDQAWNSIWENFFRKAYQYITPKEDIMSEKMLFFKEYLQDLNRFWHDLVVFQERVAAFNADKVNDGNSIKLYDWVYIFLDESLERYKSCYNNFLGIGTDDFKQCSELLGFDTDRKPFLSHITGMSNEWYKISNEEQAVVKSFMKKLKAKDIFPKPLPIFIDRKELNHDVVSIVHEGKGKLSFNDIFERLYEKGKDSFKGDDLGNYYLLYAQIENKKLGIKDFEYVPSFLYRLDYYIEPVFKTDTSHVIKIKTVFDFQKIIVGEIFDNCLVKQDEKGGWHENYWGELDIKYCKTNNMYRLLTSYRRAFYEYIYKSKREAITKDMFRDIINSNIQDVLKDYKYRVTDQQKEEKIKKLLNIYFNLNKYFDKMNNNFNQESDTFSMVQTTKDLIKGFQGLLNEENRHLEEGHDVEYAFALGQVVYYLVSQNESKNKTHSLLLPYMQLNNFNSIIQNVKNDCTKYAYKIAFSNKKFNKAFSEICGYMASTNFNNLKSYFLAGYFSKNMIYN